MIARVYPAAILEVHDGDTVRVLLDRGGDDWWRTWLRLLGGNARELHMTGGPAARDHLATLLAPWTPTRITELWLTPVTVTSASWDKYGGRIDGYLRDPAGTDISTQMIRDGYMAPWDGRGPAPIPAWPVPTE